MWYYVIMKVLFVCTGNVCRSPMAEIIFRKQIIRETKTMMNIGNRRLQITSIKVEVTLYGIFFDFQKIKQIRCM